MSGAFQKGELVWCFPIGAKEPIAGLIVSNMLRNRTYEVLYPHGLELNSESVLHRTREAAIAWNEQSVRDFGWWGKISV
jgi:hypothetical protein